MNKSIDFAAIIASSVHDMKNSLSMLMNMLEDISDLWHPTEQESRDKLDQLQYESKRLNSQLVQLLTLYKIGNSQYLLNMSEQHVAEFLNEATLHHREVFARQGVTLSVDAPDDLIWYFDRTLIHGVINNVLNNAYKYTRSRVAITAAIDDGILVISVADDGSGYPQDMLDRGAQDQTGINFESGSTGLGLFFSQKVAALHQHKQRTGSIRLDNGGFGGGGRFTILLP